ncbi:hypothetical protein [Enterobacter mori]|uniref:hypothetical protein n=1 Tax=Enterobacter mori TaxID=539813 RepID=UPI003B83A8C9
MKKFILLAGIASAIIAAFIFFVWPYLKMELASSAYYNQNDKREYDYYTPELLKNMPRTSSSYAFEYGYVSGPEAYVFTVRFHGATDTGKINNYLESSGYKHQTQCDVKAECWRAPRSRDVVTVIKYTVPDSVAVQIYRSHYVEPYIE